MRICSAGAKHGASSCSAKQQATQRVAAAQELEHGRPSLTLQQTRRQRDATDLPRKTLDEIRGIHVNPKPLKFGQIADTSHDGQIGTDVKTIACIEKKRNGRLNAKKKSPKTNDMHPETHKKKLTSQIQLQNKTQSQSKSPIPPNITLSIPRQNKQLKPYIQDAAPAVPSACRAAPPASLPLRRRYRSLQGD